jgi:hypothetical protein
MTLRLFYVMGRRTKEGESFPVSSTIVRWGVDAIAKFSEVKQNMHGSTRESRSSQLSKAWFDKPYDLK